jgi:hypothetical protein
MSNGYDRDNIHRLATFMNSCERISRRLCRGDSGQGNREVLYRIGFPAALWRGVSIPAFFIIIFAEIKI